MLSFGLLLLSPGPGAWLAVVAVHGVPLPSGRGIFGCRWRCLSPSLPNSLFPSALPNGLRSCLLASLGVLKCCSCWRSLSLASSNTLGVCGVCKSAWLRVCQWHVMSNKGPSLGGLHLQNHSHSSLWTYMPALRLALHLDIQIPVRQPIELRPSREAPEGDNGTGDLASEGVPREGDQERKESHPWAESPNAQNNSRESPPPPPPLVLPTGPRPGAGRGRARGLHTLYSQQPAPERRMF